MFFSIDVDAAAVVIVDDNDDDDDDSDVAVVVVVVKISTLLGVINHWKDSSQSFPTVSTLYNLG